MKNKVIWIVIAVIIIIAALIGILYYTTDILKTPEQLFYKYTANNFNSLGNLSYENYMEELKQSKETSFKMAGEVTAKITSSDPDAQQVAEVIEKGKIRYNLKNIGAEQKTQEDITLNYDNKDIVTLNILKNKEQYGIKIEDIYNKYVSLENNNLKEMFQKLGMDPAIVPDRIEALNYYELLKVDEVTFKHIKETYSNIVRQNIPDKNYSVEKNVIVNIDGTDIKTNAYKLTLSEEETRNVLIKILETLKTDDVTLELIVDKYSKIAESNKAFINAKSITKEGLVETIQDALDDISTESGTLEEMIQFISYGEKENKSRIELNIEESKLTIDMIKSNNDKKMLFSFIYDGMTSDTEIIFNDTKADAKIRMNVDDDTTIELNIKQEIQPTDNITVEEFTANNSVKLNDMTADEISLLVQTIYNNVVRVLPEKMQLLGISQPMQYNLIQM